MFNKAPDDFFFFFCLREHDLILMRDLLVPSVRFTGPTRLLCSLKCLSSDGCKLHEEGGARADGVNRLSLHQVFSTVLYRYRYRCTARVMQADRIRGGVVLLQMNENVTL